MDNSLCSDKLTIKGGDGRIRVLLPELKRCVEILSDEHV